MRAQAASILLAAAMAGGVSTGEPQTTQPAPASTAPEPVRNTDAWNLPRKGERLAISGYDPVAYFPEGGGEATKGDKSVTLEHRGVVYRFASAEHRDLFRAHPERYEPAHGGWCSWAMRDGDKVDVDPRSFIVRDGRLFLFYKGLLGDTRAKWLKTDHDASATAADRHWKQLSGEDPRTVPLADDADTQGRQPG